MSNEIKNYLIASHRPWNKNLPGQLQKATGQNFTLISDPEDLNTQYLNSIKPHYIFFPHWSYRISEDIFSQFECVIFHMTDLPFGRGGSPLQNLIDRKIYETQITALQCVQKLDAGPIYLKKPLSLYGSAEEIFIRASRVIEDMMIQIVQNEPKPVPQKGDPIVFKRRKPEQSQLEEHFSLEDVFDQIRMLDAEGYPHAFLQIGSLKLEFTRASLKTDCVLADVRITKIE